MNEEMEKLLFQFCKHLREEEKSRATIEKYQRDVLRFFKFCSFHQMHHVVLDKSIVISYKETLMKEYSTGSINSMLASLNRYLEYIGKSEFKVKSIKVQKQNFDVEERCLTKEEYYKLLKTAKQENNIRLQMIIETIGSTGIRISELEFFTVEQVKKDRIEVYNKGKNRTVLLPVLLKKRLMVYLKNLRINKGAIFITRSGKNMNRSNIWREIQELCKKAGVDVKKGFPHNFRHLFARAFYAINKDVIKLAVLLGHSSLETTRIYTRAPYSDYIRQLNNMKLII